MAKCLFVFLYNCAMQLLELSLACHVQKIRSNQLNIFSLSRPESSVMSMSFCSDFIQISSRFYPDFIQILFRFYPDFIQILSRFYSDFIKILFRFYPDFILILSRSLKKLSLSEFYPDVILIFEKIWIKLEKTLYPDFSQLSSR